MTEIMHQSAELVERIRKASVGLGEGARRVANFVLTRPEDIALLSAAKVAEQLGVSESTVVRLASAVGYDGYPALRRAVQEGLRRHLDPGRRLKAFVQGRDEHSAVARSFQSDISDLLATERQLDIASLNEAVNIVSSARQTYILGVRSSFGLAFTLYHHLNRTLHSVHQLNPSSGDAVDQLARLNEQDVLIGIGFPRYTRVTVELMALAAKRDVRVIAITDSAVSPLAQHASVVLTATCSADPFANSNVGALALINAIVSQVAVSNKERSVRSLNQLDQLLHESDVLYSERFRRPRLKKRR
jgi:DNA-binding MurR/RpiR family transcriptional regulator